MGPNSEPCGIPNVTFSILKLLLLLLLTVFCFGENSRFIFEHNQLFVCVVHNFLYLLLATGNLLVKCGAHVVTLPPSTTPSTTTLSTTTVSPSVNVPATTQSSTLVATPSNHLTSSEPSVEKSTGKKISDFLGTYIFYYTCF